MTVDKNLRSLRLGYVMKAEKALESVCFTEFNEAFKASDPFRELHCISVESETDRAFNASGEGIFSGYKGDEWKSALYWLANDEKDAMVHVYVRDQIGAWLIVRVMESSKDAPYGAVTV